MPNRLFLLSTLAALLLNACATTQYYWRHNQLTGQAAEQQLTADRSSCTITARSAVGAPPVSQNQPDIVTNFSGYTSSGGYVSGQARMTTQSPMFGAAAGIQQAEVENRHQDALLNVFVGCMAQRGWAIQAVGRQPLAERLGSVSSSTAGAITKSLTYKVEGSNASGRGIYMLTDGAQYEGDVVIGKPHGQGILTTKNGIRREGQFVDGSFFNGVTTYTDGSRTEWRNGEPLAQPHP